MYHKAPEMYYKITHKSDIVPQNVILYHIMWYLPHSVGFSTNNPITNYDILL